jgi:hypothetical protein
MTDHERPHVHTTTIPPGKDILLNPQRGWAEPRDSTPATKGTSNATITTTQRGMLVTGTVEYDSTEWGSVTALAEATRSGMAKSHLNISRLTAKVGETFAVDIDFQGVWDDVLVPGIGTVSGWNVELLVYDPAQPFASFDAMLPSLHGRYGANGTLNFVEIQTAQSVADWILTSTVVNTPARATVNVTVPNDAFYGPHLIIGRANFLLNDGLGTSMLQSTRMIGLIEVIPDSGQSGTALYWTTMECWLPDW